MIHSLEKWKYLKILLLFLIISLLGIIVFLIISWSVDLPLFVLNKRNSPQSSSRLVCYFTSIENEKNKSALCLREVDATICTHINIGIAGIENSSLILSDNLKHILENDLPYLRSGNAGLKLLLWIGGGNAGNGFSKMIINHDTRKIFIKSLKEILRLFKLDGVDLDWEFPSAYNKERTHFSQLLYEIRKEFVREKRDYILSVAVAAVEGIAEFAYDIREINLYTDYVNLMAYDYHFYSRKTPFTGLNAPLYARDVEHSILATLNINYSANWWLSRGLERNKLVVGLPTYGHSFTLVNPFNNGINAPAENIGTCGDKGFTTYSDVCWFISHNIGVQKSYEHRAASPYISNFKEWISYENETSIAAKTNYIRSLDVGGVMVFSLNTDDVYGSCKSLNLEDHTETITFPLTRTIKRLLFEN